jgi:hypothetical protein
VYSISSRAGVDWNDTDISETSKSQVVAILKTRIRM